MIGTMLTKTKPSPSAHKKYIAHYKALPWQIKPWRDKSAIMLLTGAAGGGKSRLAGEKIHGFMLKYPGSMGLMVRKIRQSMSNSVVLFMDKTVIGQDPRVKFRPSLFRFEYANGSVLAWGGMANKEQREHIRSIGHEGKVDIVWLEEAVQFEESDLNEILARMRGTAADWTQIMLSTNPGGPEHFINKRLILGKQASVHYSSAKDNPYNPASYLESLDMLTGIQRQRLLEGKWVQAEGVVYKEFDTANIERVEPNPELSVELGVDDGYVDPRAILFIQQTPTNIIVFDEIYHSRHLAEVCVNETIARCESYGLELPEICIGPPEAKELQTRFRNADIPYRFKVHKIIEGIAAVRPLIKDSSGYRSLIVNPRCKNFIGELTDGYKYPEQGSKRDDENPIDKNNHACDGFRYWVYSRAR